MPVPRPRRASPIGLRVTSTAKAVSRAFDEALSAAGGSRPVWTVLTALRDRPLASQRELAESMGIRGATLTHHLNAMERADLITRRRDPTNRRVHVVELTAHGEAAFDQMRGAALDFDRRLRAGFDDDEIAVLERLLERLHGNVTGPRRSGERSRRRVRRPSRSS